ncbi:aspartyl-tRNA synthetase [Aulographum hederae CBS 113979]|uniref:Aspartyl-tRNA synthetase n=1 Tax=Aulographum hederae CBS 113979 TaxID=1176131 RepID=A0A6G1HAR5_9PEZI|nr:aspartyl-tRNA synthetase [Aulographum hederae CBS 113979]
MRRPFSSKLPRRNEASSSLKKLDSFKASFTFPPATSEVKDLSLAKLGQEVVLHGYIGPQAVLSKKLLFIQLVSKDGSHSVQLVSFANDARKESHIALQRLPRLTPVVVRGTVKERKRSNKENRYSTRIDDVEVDLIDVQSLNDFPEELHFAEGAGYPPKYRHLQIRTDPELRHALVVRSKAASVCRSELEKEGFLEFETPLLFKSTPEGAREFLVPTRTEGLFYALPQSPQQYKQILMASGMSNYYQLAKCFRDEDMRADRQPEFTQLDIEMSFVTGEEVMKIVEDLLRRLWQDILGIELPEQFPRMSYYNAMKHYGSDKPDLRLGMKIMQIGWMVPVDLISKITPLNNPAVDAMKLHVSDDPVVTRQFLIDFMESPDAAEFKENPHGEPGFFIFDSSKPLQGLQPFGFETAEILEKEDCLDLQDGDLVIIQARPQPPFTGGSTAMGRLRTALHKAAVAESHITKPAGFKFLWVNDFPLFTPSNAEDPGQGGTAGFSSTHHPFTAPKDESDIDLLETNPQSILADHYDVVVNGVELGGGSRRIHNSELQEFVFSEVLKMSKERLEDFRHLLEVLRGAPPHAGIALGFDRLLAVMLGKESVKDVIAFPKWKNGKDPLVDSPGTATPEQLDVYHLRTKNQAGSVA